MKSIHFLRKPFYSAVTFFILAATFSAGYALSGWLSAADKVSTGSGLSAASWNRIIDGVMDLDSRVVSVSGKIGTLSNGKWCVSDGAKIDCTSTAPTGTVGPQWPTGAAGPQWPTGPQGPSGSAWAVWPTWPQWPTGATGPQWPSGAASIVSESACNSGNSGKTALGVIASANPDTGALQTIVLRTCTCTYKSTFFAGWYWMYSGTVCS